MKQPNGNRVCRSDFVDGGRDMFGIFTECCGLFCCDAKYNDGNGFIKNDGVHRYKVIFVHIPY